MKHTALLLLCAVALCLAGCAPQQSTDLSRVTVDGISLGDSEAALDLSRYHPSDRYSGAYAYRFEELVLDVQNGCVSYLFARVDEGVDVAVNGAHPTTFAELTALLGSGYTDAVYDREQQLRSCSYTDFDRAVTAQFVYISFNGQLLWVTLQPLR